MQVSILAEKASMSLSAGFGRWPVFQPGDLEDVEHAEPLLPIIDEEEVVVHEPLLLHHLPPHPTSLSPTATKP